jgi:hypothetical protein
MGLRSVNCVIQSGFQNEESNGASIDTCLPTKCVQRED